MNEHNEQSDTRTFPFRGSLTHPSLREMKYDLSMLQCALTFWCSMYVPSVVASWRHRFWYTCTYREFDDEAPPPTAWKVLDGSTKGHCMHVGHHLAQPMGMSMPELTVSDHALAYGQISGEFKGGSGRPLLAHIFFQNAACFRVKGIYFVVRIRDKWGRSWQIVFRPPPFQKFLFRGWDRSYSLLNDSTEKTSRNIQQQKNEKRAKGNDSDISPSHATFYSPETGSKATVN